jgi:hypothetical protein
MTTTSVAFPLANDRESSLTKGSVASNRLAMGVLTLTLLLSFLQYCFERSDVTRLVPVSLLITGAALLLVTSSREKRRSFLEAVVHPSTAAIIVAVSFPPLVSSLYRASSYSVQYGTVMVVFLIAARIFLSEIGLEGLLLSFFYATTVGILIVVGLTSSDLMASIGSTRYAPMYFDPNRIGFFAVTAVPSQLWFAMRRPGRKYVLLVSALCVFVTLAASSRGSIGALLIGTSVTASLYSARLLKYPSSAVSRNKLIGVLVLLSLLTVAVAAERPAFENAGNYLWTKLELDTRARGLDSGFTGRAYNWAAVLVVLPKTSWLYGNGYRTTDEDFDFAVDNGYVSAIYEIGLVSTSIAMAKYLLFICLLAIAYVSNESASGTCLPVFIFTFVVFLCNAFVHRVLFGYGDQVSILALFAFVSTRQDIFAAIPGMPAKLRVPRNPVEAL